MQGVVPQPYVDIRLARQQIEKFVDVQVVHQVRMMAANVQRICWNSLAVVVCPLDGLS